MYQPCRGCALRAHGGRRDKPAGATAQGKRENRHNARPPAQREGRPPRHSSCKSGQAGGGTTAGGAGVGAKARGADGAQSGGWRERLGQVIAKRGHATGAAKTAWEPGGHSP